MNLSSKSLLICLAGLTALGLMASGCASGRSVYNEKVKYPPGLAVGHISGPASDVLAGELKKRSSGGQTQALLNGVVSISRHTRPEKELVPETRTIGKPYQAYRPDPFTGRLWLTEEYATAEDLNAYDLERFSGSLLFDWQMVSASDGRVLDQGRVAVDIERTQGGYLAKKKMTKPLGRSGADRQLEKRLADEMVYLLALDLGNYAGRSELETSGHPMSRKAKNLAAGGNWEEAKSLWLEILELNPEYAPALFNLGLYWERKKDPEQAWLYYKKAFVSDGSIQHRTALTRLTETLQRAGRLPGRFSSERDL